jgi:uncharacterized membrane protein
MEQVVVAPSADSRRRTSIIATSLIAAALVIVSIVFAVNTPWYFVFKMLHVRAAMVWVGGGLFITIIAVLAELANDDDQLLQIAMTMNFNIPYNQFWLIFGLVAWALSAGTGILFLGPEAKRLNKAAAAHGPRSPEVQARLRRILLVVRVDVALMFLIVFDMVAKPFS